MFFGATKYIGRYYNIPFFNITTKMSFQIQIGLGRCVVMIHFYLKNEMTYLVGHVHLSFPIHI